MLVVVRLLFHCLRFFIFPRHFGVLFLLSGRDGLDLVLRAPFTHIHNSSLVPMIFSSS